MTYKVRPEDEKSGAKMLRLTEQFHLPPELWFLNLSDCKLIKVHFQCMADIWLVGVRKGVAMSLPLVLVNDNTFPLMKITPSLLKEAATIQEEPAEEKLPDDVTFLVKEEQDVKKKYGDSGDVIVKDTLRKKHREFSTDNGVTFTLFESRE
ncbi:hypothetical protein B566_EDAN017377 [Ephemera danica]|nr:hypothetical protein B566_EDAN017377 [Ephemera danica]